MEELTEVWPKLKQDSVFLQTEEGVFLRSDEASFLLKGKSIYRWISTLSPYLTGEHTLDKLCEGLESAQRDTVIRLVDILLRRGVLKNELPEAPGLLSDEVRNRFRSQIEFIDHYTDYPQKRFKAFRDSRLLLIGSGESFTALVISLVGNGLKGLFLAPTDEPEKFLRGLEPKVSTLRQGGIEESSSVVDFQLQSSSGSLDGYEIVVYCSDNGSLKEVFNLHQRCISEGRVFLPAVVFAGQAIIGPLVRPPNGPCWLCALIRLSANVDGNRSAALWKALVLGNDLCSKNATLFAPIARRLGNGLAFELFKILAGPLASETESGVILQDLETLESHHGKLVRHPLCPSCSHFDFDIGIQQTLEIVAGKQDKEQTRKEELLRQGIPLFDPYIGVFNKFIDDEISQVPLKMSRLKVASSTSPISGQLEVTAYSVETVLDARYAAFLEGIRRYTKELPDTRGMVSASFNEMVERGKMAFAAQMLSTWSGNPSFKRDSCCEWMPAFSLFTQRLCYVPAATVYPHSPLNRLGIFERTSAGSAVGLTFRDTLTIGIISALGYEQVRDVIQGRSSVVILDSEVLEVSNTDLDFLLKSAKRFERPFTLLEVLHESPLRVILAYTTDSLTDQISTIGIGFSGIEAANKALLNLVGSLQLLKYEGNLPDSSESLFPEFSPRSDLVYAHPTANRFKEPATTIKHIEDYLEERGRDVLFVNDTTTDIWEKETFISGTILLTQAAKEI